MWMIWPFNIILRGEEDYAPEGYIKNGNRLHKIYNPRIEKDDFMTKKLISLEEHNKIATQINESGGNGIACPNCGSELFDNGETLLCWPNQYLTICRECNYKGSRY
jgi:hypothetical protein